MFFGETRRLSLRTMEASDLDSLFALLSDEKVMRYLEPPFSLEKTKQFLEKAGLSRPPLIYAVEREGRFIGYAIYHPYDAGSMEIGWVLFPEVWGKGYARELTDFLAEKARSEGMGAVIECVPEQAATRKIALGQGFVFQGTAGGCEVYRLGSGDNR